MVCPNCGTPLPEDARFCPNCGTPVAAPAVQERKLVTVVFADLAGSTELATHLDPERYREVMQAFYQMVSRELASLRGRAEKFVGDAVMAVFGLPHAHEDDALRAVRGGGHGVPGRRARAAIRAPGHPDRRPRARAVAPRRHVPPRDGHPARPSVHRSR